MISLHRQSVVSTGVFLSALLLAVSVVTPLRAAPGDEDGLVADQPATEQEAEEAIEEFQQKLKEASGPSDVQRALGTLSETEHPKVASFLLTLLKRQPGTESAKKVLDGIEKTGDFRIAPDLGNVLKEYKKRKEVYVKGIKVLGSLGSRRVTPQLLKELNGVTAAKLDRAEAAIGALVELNDYRAIQPMIDKLEWFRNLRDKWSDPEHHPSQQRQEIMETLTPVIQNALVSITGQDSISGPGPWRNWYNENRRKIQKKIREQKQEEKEKWRELYKQKQKEADSSSNS